MRRAAALVAVGILPLAQGALATPVFAANATPATISAECSGSTLTETTLSVTGYEGDTITLSVTGAVAVQFIRNGTSVINWAGSSSQILSAGSSLVATLGSTSGNFYIDGRSPCNGQTHIVAVTIIPGANPNSGGTPSGQSPTPVVQQFGMPAAGTCSAAGGADLNWAGVASGGWSVSWAEWMNGGRGGVVCTRTLVYDTRAAAWAVAA